LWFSDGTGREFPGVSSLHPLVATTVMTFHCWCLAIWKVFPSLSSSGLCGRNATILHSNCIDFFTTKRATPHLCRPPPPSASPLRYRRAKLGCCYRHRYGRMRQWWRWRRPGAGEVLYPALCGTESLPGSNGPSQFGPTGTGFFLPFSV
jgi:hypothetical protein